MVKKARRGDRAALAAMFFKGSIDADNIQAGDADEEEGEEDEEDGGYDSAAEEDAAETG